MGVLHNICEEEAPHKSANEKVSAQSKKNMKSFVLVDPSLVYTHTVPIQFIIWLDIIVGSHKFVIIYHLQVVSRAGRSGGSDSIWTAADTIAMWPQVRRRHTA